ncbi:MAG: hypothetical protein AAGJ31_13485, partial [Verrucomicrobiota bacterium]
ETLQCIACHAIGHIGGKVGPDLVSIGASAPVDYLIESLLLPHKKIKEGYHTNLITLGSGETIAGGISKETDAELFVRNALGDIQPIRKAEIVSRQVSPLSLMPAGLTLSLREDEFVDLIRFLSELGKEGPFKTRPTSHVRAWNALLPHERVRDDIGHYGPRIFAEPDASYRFRPVVSRVNGSLPIQELPKQIGRGKNRWVAVRTSIAAEDRSKMLKLNDTTLLHVFQGEVPLPFPDKGPALIPLLQEGSETLTFAVNAAYRPMDLSVELVDPAPQATRNSTQVPLSLGGSTASPPISPDARGSKLPKSRPS